MRSLDEYIALAGQIHGHICAGQILGIRMAMYGLELLGIQNPEGKDRKRLITFVEIDRCLTDAIMVVTGCRLGKRALKFRDFGKPAATFYDCATGRAVRLVAKESAKEAAGALFPEVPDKRVRELQAYRILPVEQLFDVQWVKVELAPEDMPGYRGSKVTCEQCGEPVSFHREVRRGGRILCRACAGEAYYQSLKE